MWRKPNEVKRSEIDAAFKERLQYAKEALLIDHERQIDEETKYALKNTDRWWKTIIKRKYNLTDKVRTHLPTICYSCMSGQF
jgi:hypothetical protein